MKCVSYNPNCPHCKRTAKRIRGRHDSAYRCTKCGVRFHVLTDYQYYTEQGYTKEEINNILKDEENAKKNHKPQDNTTTRPVVYTVYIITKGTSTTTKWEINKNDTSGTWI